MTNCCYTGALAKFKIAGQWIDFIEFDPYEVYQHLSDGSAESIRGDLEHLASDVDLGPLFAKYKLTIQLTPEKLNYLLPIMPFTQGSGSSGSSSGGSGSGTNTWTSNSTGVTFDSKLETPSGSLFTFTNCMVNAWSIQGRKGGGPIRMILDIWASQLVISAAGVESWANIVTGTVYAFTRGTLNLGGTAYQYDQFTLDANYRLIYQHNNNLNVTTICPSDSVSQLQTSIPYNTCQATTGLLTGVWGVDTATSQMPAVLDFTRGTHETKISVAEIISLGRIPRINKFNEIRLPFQANCYRTSTTPMFTILNI